MNLLKWNWLNRITVHLESVITVCLSMLSNIFIFIRLLHTCISLQVIKRTTVKLLLFPCNHMIEKTRKKAGKIFSCRFAFPVASGRGCFAEFIINHMKDMYAIFNELNNCNFSRMIFPHREFNEMNKLRGVDKYSLIISYERVCVWECICSNMMCIVYL